MTRQAETEQLFGKTFACECGRTHRIEPREVVFEPGVLEKVPGLCARAVPVPGSDREPVPDLDRGKGRRAAVVMDVRTREVAGAELARRLSSEGWAVSELLVPDRTNGQVPECDDVTKEKLAAVLGPADLLVAVGSGVVTDLTRWLAEERKRPFVSFATAASMNGYASSNAAPTIAGVKRLKWAHPPVALAADPEIIAAAPWRMTASGLGDVLAKSVSATDWRLNQLLFGDYYCPRSVNLIAEIEPLYLEHPDELKARSLRAMDALFRALLLTGAAMTMAGTSSPASGGEHLISHALDMLSLRDESEHDLHGRQVGVGTVLASELYRRVLAVESPRVAAAPASADERFWGKLAGEMKQECAAKAERLRQAAKRLGRGHEWDRIRADLAPLTRTPETIQGCLLRAGAAARAADIRISKGQLLDVLLHAHEIRSRFTILDLARLVGVMPQAAEEIVERWG
jgi:glycerol-1-phosphate dehydrogenase [NAD(P)+]